MKADPAKFSYAQLKELCKPEKLFKVVDYSDLPPGIYPGPCTEVSNHNPFYYYLISNGGVMSGHSSVRGISLNALEKTSLTGSLHQQKAYWPDKLAARIIDLDGNLVEDDCIVGGQLQLSLF